MGGGRHGDGRIRLGARMRHSQAGRRTHPEFDQYGEHAVQFLSRAERGSGLGVSCDQEEHRSIHCMLRR